MADKVFLYPGQGSQAIGMGVSVAGVFPEAASIFRAASDIAGYDILALCAEGPMEKLSRTCYTQPALFTVEAAITDALRARGVHPSAAAGHSLGEFGAWYAAGVFGFEDGFSLVSERARLMDDADPEGKGTMAVVIGLPEETVREVCDSITGVVTANLNSPLQTVISGEKGAVEKAGKILRGRGAKRVLVLPVSGAFHSPLMENAEKAFAAAVEKTRISDAVIPVYANVTALPVTRAEEIRGLMTRQLVSPVRWTDTVRNMAADGNLEGFEIGPGTVLAGLVKRTIDSFDVRPVSEPAHIAEAAHETA
jgi:[acyl-carrier-protein] S-malonyltransferase